MALQITMDSIPLVPPTHVALSAPAPVSVSGAASHRSHSSRKRALDSYSQPPHSGSEYTDDDEDDFQDDLYMCDTLITGVVHGRMPSLMHSDTSRSPARTPPPAVKRMSKTRTKTRHRTKPRGGGSFMDKLALDCDSSEDRYMVKRRRRHPALRKSSSVSTASSSRRSHSSHSHSRGEERTSHGGSRVAHAHSHSHSHKANPRLLSSKSYSHSSDCCSHAHSYTGAVKGKSEGRRSHAPATKKVRMGRMPSLVVRTMSPVLEESDEHLHSMTPGNTASPKTPKKQYLQKSKSKEKDSVTVGICVTTITDEKEEGKYDCEDGDGELARNNSFPCLRQLPSSPPKVERTGTRKPTRTTSLSSSLSWATATTSDDVVVVVDGKYTEEKMAMAMTGTSGTRTTSSCLQGDGDSTHTRPLLLKGSSMALPLSASGSGGHSRWTREEREHMRTLLRSLPKRIQIQSLEFVSNRQKKYFHVLLKAHGVSERRVRNDLYLFLRDDPSASWSCAHVIQKIVDARIHQQQSRGSSYGGCSSSSEDSSECCRSAAELKLVQRMTRKFESWPQRDRLQLAVFVWKSTFQEFHDYATQLGVDDTHMEALWSHVCKVLDSSGIARTHVIPEECKDFVRMRRVSRLEKFRKKKGGNSSADAVSKSPPSSGRKKKWFSKFSSVFRKSMLSHSLSLPTSADESKMPSAADVHCSTTIPLASASTSALMTSFSSGSGKLWTGDRREDFFVVALKGPAPACTMQFGD